MEPWWRVDLWRPGYQLALVLGVLACAVSATGWLLVRRNLTGPRRLPRASPLEPGFPDPALGGGGWADALAQSAQALERFDAMQSSLRERLNRSREMLQSDRKSLGSAVELMKRAALEMRLPQTLFELYEGLRLRPRKPAQAQEEDLRWHRRIGVSPGGVLVFDEASRHTRVDFGFGGLGWRIVGRSYELSRLTFDELALFDAQGTALAVVRVRLSAERTVVTEASVQRYRPGEWVEMMASCRVAMDERREELMLDMQYRDLHRLKDDFGLSDSLLAGGAAP